MSADTMYVTPSDPNSSLIEPPPEKLYAESGFRLKGAYFIQTVGLTKVTDIMTALASARPVSIAIPASGPVFQGYTSGVLQALSGPIDHANLLVDYTWTGTTEQFASWQNGATGLDQYLYFWDVNSWGAWGVSDIPGIPAGLCQAGRGFIDQLEDPCVLDLVRV